MVSHDTLDKLYSHWAFLEIDRKDIERALEVTKSRLIKNAIGNQIDLNFNEKFSDDENLFRISMAFEVVAIEGLQAFIHQASGSEELIEQCAAGAWQAFELRSIVPLSGTQEDIILNFLHISALAYCGDRWSDLRRWYTDNEFILHTPSVADVKWEKRILYRLFDCWIRLFRKKRWDDLDQIREIIAGLRVDQKDFESTALNSDSNIENSVTALRLLALYHWTKATEMLAIYMLQGESANISTLLDKHFESSIDSAVICADKKLELLLRWLHAASRQMVRGSLWWVARTINSRVTKFVGEITKQRSMFELLPPQQAALQEQGLLDSAATAVVVDLPTSGGKTLLAQFRILQALNQFDKEQGWVAYVAPTKALTAQITRRLRRDFAPIGITVEQLTGAVEIDSFEEELLIRQDAKVSFDILICTPEKLQLVIRNKKVPRPLALVVMDEAHNLEDETRGLRIELLLATIKRDYALANFLLLMPYVEKAETLARWLADDIKAGRTISLGTTAWKANERIVGIYQINKDASIRGGWTLDYETMVTSPKTIHLKGKHKVGNIKPFNMPFSDAKSLSIQTAAMAKIFSSRGTSIAIARTPSDVWTMARQLSKNMPLLEDLSENIVLVQNFLRTEVSSNFELIDMLSKGIGVHHSGISDEVRTLIEWLSESEDLKVLCATSTIAQGINFPVSSVFIASCSIPSKKQSRDMTARDFWNLAGRAGRIDQDSVGVVGIAGGKNVNKIKEFVSKSTGSLVSRFVNMMNDLDEQGKLHQLDTIIYQQQWEDFRCYIAHLWSEKKNLDSVLSDTEQLLRNTYGYGLLRETKNGKEKTEKLLEVTKIYARSLAGKEGIAQLADTTGFSPEGVLKAMVGINKLENKLDLANWNCESLFGSNSKDMENLYGVMLNIPQLSESLIELGGHGAQQKHIADITKDWVSGQSIQEIAKKYFNLEGATETESITNACKAIYRNLINIGTWGLSAISKMYGINFDELPEEDKRRINNLPAMIYHGVNTEEAVLMRMNNIPRSISFNLGTAYGETIPEGDLSCISTAKTFLKNLSSNVWESSKPKHSRLSGEDYKKIWNILSGNSINH